MSYLPSLPGQTIKEYPHVTEAEAELIWTEAKTPRIRCFVKTLWFTGLRISEVLRLTVRDVRRTGLDYSLFIEHHPVEETKSTTGIITHSKGVW